jgi:GAF domain-containing protein
LNPFPFTTTAEGPVDLGALSTIERLREIATYNLFAHALRTELDVVCQRTAERLNQPIGLVTIVLDSAQLVVGRSGLAGWIAATEGTPAEWSFCARAVISGEPYVVPDAPRDPVQSLNPLVMMDSVNAYAGVPLRSANGQLLGAHCVLNDKPQEFSTDDIEILEQAGAEIVGIMERYRRVT